MKLHEFKGFKRSNLKNAVNVNDPVEDEPADLESYINRSLERLESVRIIGGNTHEFVANIPKTCR